METVITMLMLCTVVFFIIFAAKSKAHFQSKPLILEQGEEVGFVDDTDDATACICDLDGK